MAATESDSVHIKNNPPYMKDLYESILDGLACGVWVSDGNDVIFYANKGMEMIAGVTQQKLIGSNVLHDTAKSTIKCFAEHYIEAKETSNPVYYSEIPVTTPAGKNTYQSGWLIPIIKKGFFEGMICTVEDITNQKQTRRALRESEAKYGQLVENANSIILQMDLNGNITFFNKFAREFFGFDEDGIIGRNVVGTIVPNSDKFVKGVEAMLNGIAKNPARYANREYQGIRKDGELVWISWTNKAVSDENGHIKEILCIGNDTTKCRCSVEELRKCRVSLEKVVRKRTAELKKANEDLRQEIHERQWVEKILRSSEEKYRIVAENASGGIVISQDGFFKYANPKAVKILGYPKEELLSRPFIEFIHPDDRDVLIEKFIKRLQGDLLPTVYSCRIIDKDNNIKWIEINANLITWMGRLATLTFFNNITERKMTEERLRLLESAIQQANDSIIITTAGYNPSGSKVVFVNPAFSRMTGYTDEEVMGNPALIQQATIIERSEATDRETFCVETIDFHKNGSQFNLEWQIAPVRDEKGKVKHFIIIQRDITERKRAEEELDAYQEQLRSLASELLLAEEKERRRIATNLHDHIGQTLAITKIKLGQLQDSLYSTTSHNGLIDDIRTLIERTIKYTKNLTFELSPPILYELGFEATMEWLCEQFQKQHNILFFFENDGNPKPLDNDVGILMFQAVRELFINIVKHAHANKVIVKLLRDGNTMQITVEDDGAGFELSKIERTSFGFFSIHERLKHFGGTFTIDSKPGRGTLVTLTSPVRFDRQNR